MRTRVLLTRPDRRGASLATAIVVAAACIALPGAPAEARSSERALQSVARADVDARGRPASLRPQAKRGWGARCRAWISNAVRRVRESAVGQFCRGLFIDGPRGTWDGIKRRPGMFVAGLLAAGAIGGAGALFGLPAHQILIGLSGGAALLDGWKTYRSSYRHAANRRERARIAGRMAWLPCLVGATALAGGAIDHSGIGAPASSQMGRLFVGFGSGVITGGDAPMALVTALQHDRRLRLEIARDRAHALARQRANALRSMWEPRPAGADVSGERALPAAGGSAR